MIDVTLNGQWKLKLPEQRAATWAQNWEFERINAMHANIKKDDFIVYCGAEQGDIPALLASWGAKLLLVEPTEEVWPAIKKTFIANKLQPPIASFAGFAANFRSDYDLYTFRALDGYPACAEGRLRDDTGFRHLNEGNAPKDKLDNLCDGYNVDIITMDTEGSELEILKGAYSTLHKHKPMLFISVHPEFMKERYGNYANDLFVYLFELGYQSKVLAYDHEWHVVFWHPDGRRYEYYER